jgi:16S rRNA (cytosine967-C5)-methyltransferase
MWLRVNSQRIDGGVLFESCGRRDWARAEPRVPQALVLDAPCDVHELPGFAQGLVSVQDSGSAVRGIPAGARRGPAGARCLRGARRQDRADGGARARPGQALVAVDIDPQRLARVRARICARRTWRAAVTGDAAAPGAWWDGVPFDRILLDAPCSALGRDPPPSRIFGCVSPRRTSTNCRRCRAPADAAWRLLAPGGRLVYATCTVTRSENRDVFAAFLRGTPMRASFRRSDWEGWPGSARRMSSAGRFFPGRRVPTASIMLP